ncbi:triosephosphate isomerase [Cnuella takakiae]|uniref:Triosephosphate isomerase n=1 Tax=Cnuella takakiae TaxID=1302690 RepID=A0A1M5HFG0_9BACT|nr:triose-phosphate isomerase [Cnuella takakiae]OLY92853.1 triose-phosphate isomerase [Cnuella takakiae]SHG14685.1 triosephosphate isomerase [Cnuella takakiae]
MRKQIAAANWKMNLSYQQAAGLLDELLAQQIELAPNQEVIFAVPFPYLAMAKEKVAGKTNYFVAAQNCSDKKSGAYTGETSVEQLQSIGIGHIVIGHSERREYYNESNAVLATKVDLCLAAGVTPIFCCGEPLPIREAETQNAFVQQQLEESLFHLTVEQVSKVVIAYEPIWAIGTGKTASTQQAQDMQQHLRKVLADKFGADVADGISILYGGSVKAANAVEIFASPDVDGGLVGGASLQAAEFTAIIQALKK